MKKLLFAMTAATLLVAGSAAFANPSEEAEGDYAGWKAARRGCYSGGPPPKDSASQRKAFSLARNA